MDYKTPTGLQLVGRPPARYRLGHGRGRHLRRQRRAQHGDVLRPERRAGRQRATSICIRRIAIRPAARPRCCRPQFLRPYRGYQNIRARGNSGTADYHSLQMQANRRYIRGLQFGGAYTLAARPGPRRRGSRQPVDQRSTGRSTSITASSRTARRTTPRSTTPGTFPGTTAAPLGMLLDGWQLSGSNAFVSGEWAAVSFTTPDNFDFTGGEGGHGRRLGGTNPVHGTFARCSSAIRWPAAAIR